MHNGYNNMKRQRGRGRRPGGGGGGGGGQHHHSNNPNRAMESSGPEVKVRGPASVIYERYLQLSRDAAGAGDRVLSENYAQHADHYFRLVRSMQPATPPPPQQNFNEGAEFEGEEGAAESAEINSEAESTGEEGGEQPDVDFPSGEQQQQFNRERGEGDFRGRRRGRRNRYRGDGERGERGEGDMRSGEGGESRDDDGDRGEQRAERQDRGERQERSERRERQPREREEQAGPEGFSNGPKPAFLRDN